ncbi:hypothetical protein V6Z11_1Z017000 [Gossypium hirsutum]
MVSYSQQPQERLKLDFKSPWDRRRDAQEFKGGVKCPLMLNPSFCGWGLFSEGYVQQRTCSVHILN